MNDLAIWLIKLYKKASKNAQKRCKYMPTCSSYALECYYKFGFIYASILTAFRIIRCNPFSKGGYNPPPLNSIEKRVLRLDKYLESLK